MGFLVFTYACTDTINVNLKTFMENRNYPTIEDAFGNLEDRTELGKSRSVWKATYKEGMEEGKDFIVKARTSESELEALKYLYGLEVGETLLMSDQNSLVVKKEDGVRVDEFIDTILSKYKEKTQESSQEESKSKIKLLNSFKRDIPDDKLYEDEVAKKFAVELTSKNFFLLLNGIFHNDIKGDNVFASSNGSVKYIDFGQCKTLGGKERSSGYYQHPVSKNLRDSIELLKHFGTQFKNLEDRLYSDIRYDQLNIGPLMTEVHNDYTKGIAPLKDRPAYLYNKILENPNILKQEIEFYGLEPKFNELLEKQLTELIKKSAEGIKTEV